MIPTHQVSRGDVSADDGDAARLFEDSSFDVVESSAVIHDNKARGKADSPPSRMRTKEKLESALVDQCIVDIQENDSLLMKEGEEKAAIEKQSVSLYGPTQLVGLLDKTVTKSSGCETINASGDLFGDDEEEDVFRDIEDDQFKKPQELDGSKSSSRLTPAKSSPKVSLTGCDEGTEVSSVAHDASGHDESSLCLKRGKRKLISSDESHNESCDSTLLLVQGCNSVLSCYARL